MLFTFPANMIPQGCIYVEKTTLTRAKVFEGKQNLVGFLKILADVAIRLENEGKRIINP